MRTGGEMYITSKAQWDEGGVEAVDERIVGTGVYRFKERTEGVNLIVEAVDIGAIQEELYHGRVTPAYRTGWVPQHEGWNPAWAERFDEVDGSTPRAPANCCRRPATAPAS